MVRWADCTFEFDRKWGNIVGIVEVAVAEVYFKCFKVLFLELTVAEKLTELL
jgi:hypothetical protein